MLGLGIFMDGRKKRWWTIGLVGYMYPIPEVGFQDAARAADYIHDLENYGGFAG